MSGNSFLGWETVIAGGFSDVVDGNLTGAGVQEWKVLERRAQILGE